MADPAPSLEVWDGLRGTLRGFFQARVPADDVDDLLQECWIRFREGLGDLREDGRLGPWVLRIANNLVVDHRRRRHPAGSIEALDDLADAGPSERDVQSLVGGWLPAMIAELPPKYAEVLRASELEGTPHRRIAERLGLSVSGVKSRVQRGRERLRAKLLACCTLEFDRRGAVRDWECRDPSCSDG